MTQKIKFLISLGNPDKKYENTYHNVGLQFIKYLEKNTDPRPYVALASNVYMNESGLFVAKTIKKTGAKPEEILIAHDDSDIGLGDYKLSFGRGSAGHKGVESIIESLKTKNFWRLRIGIRENKERNSPKTTRIKAEKFVLKKISPANQKILTNVFEKALETIKRPL